MMPRPIPHDSARGSWSPNARLIGPRTPRTAAGRAGSDRPAVIPTSRRVKATTPSDQEDRGHEANQRKAGPVVLADERDVVGRPAERAQGDERAETAEAVGDPQDDHRKSGDARRAGTAEDGRQRKGQATEEQGDETDPQGEAQRGQRRDLIAECRVTEQVGADGGRDGEDRHGQAEHGEMGGQLLECDPALAERRHGHEVEAAAAGLARERRGQARGSTTTPCRARRSRRTSSSCSRRVCRASPASRTG